MFKKGNENCNQTNTLTFHNFKSRNFKLSVSNPKNKHVAYVSVLSRISNCQSLGRKSKHEILKTDRHYSNDIIFDMIIYSFSFSLFFNIFIVIIYGRDSRSFCFFFICIFTACLVFINRNKFSKKCLSASPL